MRETKEKKYWAPLALLIFMILVAIGYFVVYPLITEIKDLNVKTQAKEQENEALNAKIVALTSLSQSFDKNPDKVKMLDLAIPNDDLQAEVIATLSNIANTSGVTVISIAQTKSEKPEYTTMTFSFESSYAGLKLFLEAIENNIRYVNVQNINLAKSTKTDVSQSYIAGSMTLNLFKYAGDKTAAQTANTEGVTNE